MVQVARNRWSARGGRSAGPLLLLLWLWSGVAMAADIEEPAWKLRDSFNGVELRDYAPSIQAKTVLAHSGETSTGFRRLAGFIFGGNDRSQKIAMTAPVQETLHDQGPVMAFTMPSQYTLDDLPRPQDASITLEEVPARTVAVVRFSGWATDASVARKTRQLLAALEQRDIVPVGVPSLNQYNPPWTPPFLRRNEIMVEVAGPVASL